MIERETPAPAELLAELLADPERSLGVPPADALRLLLALAPVVEGLRIAGAGGAALPSRRPVDGPPLLTAKEAGARLGLTPAEVYRRADRWPFARRLGPKTLRFDAAGLELYLGRNNGPRPRP